MGARLGVVIARAKSAHVWLRERGPVTLAAALLLEVSAATAADGPRARAASRALGLATLLVLVLAAAAADASLGAVVARVRAAWSATARWAMTGTTKPLLGAPIPAELLLNRKGKPLRGAALKARIAAIERERAARANGVVPRGLALASRARGGALRWVSAARARTDRAIAAARRRSGPLVAALRRSATPVMARLPAAPSLSLRTVRVVAVGVTLSFVMATALGTTGIVASRGAIALGASTTLTIIGGAVSVQEPGASEFRAARDGEVLHAGMTVRTGADAYAVLTYFEGSTVSLDPETTLVIETLEAHPDGSTVIGMRQDVGRTWHSVTRLLTTRSKYEVRTASATATVRGTAFLVGVLPALGQGLSETLIETSEGAVAAVRTLTPDAPAAEEIIVPAGFTVTARPAAAIPPAVPAPEPERRVTVSVAAPNSLVLDPLAARTARRTGGSSSRRRARRSSASTAASS